MSKEFKVAADAILNETVTTGQGARAWWPW